jgi:ABC-type nitrate/sulfonate/bicarbonate transport system ATPase subunit
MTTMQERIDALIRMRKEKPEHKMNWDRLRTALVQEAGLLTDEQKAHLNSAFKETQQEELLKMWDDRFHEVLITGEMSNGYDIAYDNSAFGSAPIKAEGRSVISNGGTSATWAPATSNVQLTKEVLEAYDKYKKDYKNDKQAY